MKNYRLLNTFLLFVAFTGCAFAQLDTATIIAEEVNLRGTPSGTGSIVSKLVKGQRVRVYANEGAWYLVQSAKFAGWLHGNYIEMPDAANDIDREMREMGMLRSSNSNRPKALPPGTYVPQDSGAIQSEYVGADLPPIVVIQNESAKRFTVTVGGAKFFVEPGDSQEITLEGGIYDFEGSAPRVIPVKGRKKFENGYRYRWIFYIRTLRS